MSLSGIPCSDKEHAKRGRKNGRCIACRKISQAKYDRSEKRAVAYKKYHQTEKGKITNRAKVARYNRTEKGKVMKSAACARYWRSEKGQVATHNRRRFTPNKLRKLELQRASYRRHKIEKLIEEWGVPFKPGDPEFAQAYIAHHREVA